MKTIYNENRNKNSLNPPLGILQGNSEASIPCRRRRQMWIRMFSQRSEKTSHLPSSRFYKKLNSLLSIYLPLVGQLGPGNPPQIRWESIENALKHTPGPAASLSIGNIEFCTPEASVPLGVNLRQTNP